MSDLIIDVQLGIKQAFDMPDLWRKALIKLMVEFPGALDNIESAFAEQRIADVRGYAHHQYSTVNICGTPVLQAALKALEFSCVYMPDRIAERLQELKMAFASVESFVELHGIPDVENSRKQYWNVCG